MGVLLVAITIAWFGGMNKRYKGPIRTIEFDEGMGIKEKPTDADEPPAAEPPSGARLGLAQAQPRRARTPSSVRARRVRQSSSRCGSTERSTGSSSAASAQRRDHAGADGAPARPRRAPWRRRPAASTRTPIVSAWS